jgi:hypothetical protein
MMIAWREAGRKALRSRVRAPAIRRDDVFAKLVLATLALTT